MESVWDYPRPPRVEPSAAHVVVELDGEVLAETRRSLRVLETSHPPVYYIPAADVRTERLRPSARRPTVCEFKGTARYYDAGDRPAVAWSYPEPWSGYEAIAGHYAFYPGRVDRATVDGEQVEAQPGDFYGGWITSAVTGPFKGGPGSAGW
ncbi:MAG TPA: DUF427 domain-containing protein [Actinomycetota bacterium]|nr:DUF427 domain-containing protein [Actinomycetota bacterium]